MSLFYPWSQHTICLHSSLETEAYFSFRTWFHWSSKWIVSCLNKSLTILNLSRNDTQLTLIVLCGFSKKKQCRASGLFHDLAAQISIPPGVCYHSSQVCLSCQRVFIVQTICVILLGPISRRTFKNTDRSLGRWRDGCKSLAPSSEQTKPVWQMVFSSSIQNIWKHENQSRYINTQWLYFCLRLMC